jgi:23S rRNA pseudouridine1911/1915/1917 synthase
MTIRSAEYSPPAAAAPESPSAAEAVVPEALDGERLDRAAVELFPGYSRARLQQWIEEGRLTRNGAPVARSRDAVRTGDRLALVVPDAPSVQPHAQAIALEVIYADQAIAIIDKPTGLIVHPGAGAPDGTLQNALLHRFPQTALLPRAGLVHRLDKDTSGLLVVALTLKAHAALVAAMAAREIRREYETVVIGLVTAGGTVDAPIARDPRNRLRMAVVAHGGRRAVTHYRVIERFAHHTYLRVRLETGRTHQIRVHMAHIRHPVVGDTLYGGRVLRGAGLPEELRRMLREFPRQALHARELALLHPESSEELVFESPLPADLQSLLTALRAAR